ncbi:hypothetical protein F5Y19DRAFT_487520 [Xylariaceae sp. FL1651]|nr:hypothetical protein F5Y19DRAFT_487520 [Xylariaceae sp. FL1651]
MAKKGIETQDPTTVTNTSSSRALLRRYETEYFLSTFAIGPPFASFITYVTFQLQTIGYVIGHAPGEAARSGCLLTATSCRVPFAGSGNVNLASYILYLNAVIYALSGALMLIISGIGDYVNCQREQYIAQLIIYGALCLPIATFRGGDLMAFNVLLGLYVAFNAIGFLAGAWQNIFIPFVMHKSEDLRSSTSQQPLDNSLELVVSDPKIAPQNPELARKTIEDGMKMGDWGSNSINGGQVVLYAISIGLTFVSAVYAGLYTTTASGALCIILSLIAWRLLPAPEPSSGQIHKGARDWLMLPLTTFALLFRQIWKYPESFKYLLRFTVYNDALFSFSSVTGQLFNLNIRPNVREFTYYSLTGPATSVISTVVFLYLRPVLKNRIGMTLRHWTILCYAITCFCALWCAIGISPSVAVGFKHRWEFYFFQVLQSISSSIASIAFKVLFSKLFPQGNETKYFGFQSVFSLGTVWIPQIVNGPIMDAINNLRLPAAISAALFLFCMVVTLLVDEGKGMRQAGYKSTGD